MARARRPRPEGVAYTTPLRQSPREKRSVLWPLESEGMGSAGRFDMTVSVWLMRDVRAIHSAR